MKLDFRPTAYHSAEGVFRVTRSRKAGLWVACFRDGGSWWPIAEDCPTPEAAFEACTAYLAAFAKEPANDIRF